jgi:hypothetical protein
MNISHPSSESNKPRNQHAADRKQNVCLVLLSVPDLFFYPEDGGDMYL